MYVYIRSEPGLYTVGFHDPKGHWRAESDHSTADLAAARVSYLNGGMRASGITSNYDYGTNKRPR